LIAVDRTLGQALTNLLDNAADASPSGIEVAGQWSGVELVLAIRDHGPGLTPEAAGKAGTPFFTTKQDDGMGLGLYLARLILERFGGSVVLENHPRGGTLTRVRLPLKPLLLKESHDLNGLR
jgi:two-component system sensor histidine kinase RegB